MSQIPEWLPNKVRFALGGFEKLQNLTATYYLWFNIPEHKMRGAVYDHQEMEMLTYYMNEAIKSLAEKSIDLQQDTASDNIMLVKASMKDLGFPEDLVARIPDGLVFSDPHIARKGSVIHISNALIQLGIDKNVADQTASLISRFEYFKAIAQLKK